MDTQINSRTPKLLIFLIGAVVGVILAASIFWVKSYIDKNKQVEKTETQTQGIILSISTPNDGYVTSDSSVNIIGSTGKDSVVAVTGGTKDIITETTNSNFKAKVGLEEGENTITVYSFDVNSGESVQTSLNILYLAEEFALNNVLVAAENTDTIKKNTDRIQKLKEQISTSSPELKKNSSSLKRTHVFGIIESIEDTTLTVDTNKGLKTAFTDDFTKFIFIDQEGRKGITLTDLKIGDKVSVVGVGKDDTNGLAKFVIVQNKPFAKRHALLGKVKEISETSLILTHLTRTDRKFMINITNDTTIKIKGVDEASIADIKVGDIMIVSGSVNNEGTINAEKIFVVPGKFKGVEPKESTKSATPSSTQ